MITNVANSPTTPNLAILTFRLAEQIYSLAIADVVKIIEMVTLTHLPQAPQGVQGIINIQGQITPVLDLRLRFGLNPEPYHLHTPIILTDFKGKTMGLIVDEVETILEVSQADLESSTTFLPPELVGCSLSTGFNPTAYLVGVAKVERRLIPLLKIEALLTFDEQAHLDQAVTAFH